MNNNNTISINYSDEKLRVLVEEYITQQRDTFTLKGVCSYILYWAMEDGNANGVYEGYQMIDADSDRVRHILELIVKEGRVLVMADGGYKKLSD